MSTPSQATNGRETLDLALSQLQGVLPARGRRVLAWLCSPTSGWVRIPLGALCIVASAFWFLPVIGIELLPIGLLLLAQDVPWLRRPVGLLILFGLGQWRRMRHWYRARRR